jgi:hypothetical protein
VKRYLVLAGDDYYPAGWDDFCGSASTIEAARKLGDWKDWYEIVDTETENIVEVGRKGKPSE